MNLLIVFATVIVLVASLVWRWIRKPRIPKDESFTLPPVMPVEQPATAISEPDKTLEISSPLPESASPLSESPLEANKETEQCVLIKEAEVSPEALTSTVVTPTKPVEDTTPVHLVAFDHVSPDSANITPKEPTVPPAELVPLTTEPHEEQIIVPVEPAAKPPAVDIPLQHEALSSEPEAPAISHDDKQIGELVTKESVITNQKDSEVVVSPLSPEAQTVALSSETQTVVATGDTKKEPIPSQESTHSEIKPAPKPVEPSKPSPAVPVPTLSQPSLPAQLPHSVPKTVPPTPPTHSPAPPPKSAAAPPQVLPVVRFQGGELLQRLPSYSADGPANHWFPMDGTSLSVRGLHYLTDKIKYPSAPAGLDLFALDIIKSSRRIDHIMDHAQCPLKPVIGKTATKYFVVCFQVPMDGNVLHFSAYSKIPDPPNPRLSEPAWRMLQKCMNPSTPDSYRNTRLKIIPSLAVGSWLAKKAVGNKPAILGNKLTCKYFARPDYLEIDVDVGSSYAGTSVFSVVRSYVKGLVVDLAMLFEGQDISELPEQILFAMRLYHVDLETLFQKIPRYN
ncbi:lipid binding protein [Pelomyxa schiedti]|nr:lipid binding protein [Pelomyxa schiedti]